VALSSPTTTGGNSSKNLWEINKKFTFLQPKFSALARVATSFLDKSSGQNKRAAPSLAQPF
jgi:hypothetical protein